MRCEKSKRHIIVLKFSRFFKPESLNLLVNRIEIMNLHRTYYSYSFVNKLFGFSIEFERKNISFIIGGLVIDLKPRFS